MKREIASKTENRSVASDESVGSDEHNEPRVTNSQAEIEDEIILEEPLDRTTGWRIPSRK